jgi:hypothetical protein
MNLNSNFEEMVHAHMEATRIAFDAGYEAGWQAAITEALRIVKPLSESSEAVIAASREPALTRRQAG